MKKKISVFLVGVFLISILDSGLTQAVFFEDTEESDVEIEFLAESGVVQGRSEGAYVPEGLVNRAEMLKILLESVDISPDETTYKNCFPDVGEEWFAKYVCYAKENGIIAGYPDGFFRPGNTVNLAEALKMSFNSFAVEFEEDGNDVEWYAAFVEGGEEYGVTDQGYDPGDFVSRRAMAEITARTAVVQVTQDKFTQRALWQIRGWGKSIQKLVDKQEIPNLRENLSEINDNEWIVKITAEDGDLFEIFYSHYDAPFRAEEGVEEVSLPPTIEIEAGTGIADIGLDSDLAWDGLVSPVEKSVLVDADLYGFFNASINLAFWPDDRKVYVYSDLKKKSGVFDLETGQVSGDVEITKGVQNLQDFFAQSQGRPFAVCVSDAAGWMGEIGIFDDYKTVGVRECMFYKSDKEEPLVIKPILPVMVKGGGKKKLPRKPVKGPGGSSGSGAGSGSGPDDIIIGPGAGDGTLGPEPFTPDPFNGDEVEEDEGDMMVPEPEDPFPAPQRSPGKGYAKPEEGTTYREDELKGAEDNHAENLEATRVNEASFTKGQAELEKLMQERGIDPPEPPQFDASVCGLDIDCSTEAGRKKYAERVKCLSDQLDQTYKELAVALKSINFWVNRVIGLERAEVQFAQLRLFADTEKRVLRVAIDVIMGGDGGLLDGFLVGLIAQYFGDDMGDGFKVAIDPKSAGESLKEAVQRKLEGFAADITGFKKKVGEIATKLADFMMLQGNEKKKFIEDLQSRFGEQPSNLLKREEWFKAVTDAIMNSVIGPAQDFLDIVNKLRNKLHDDLRTAWEKTNLLSQINAVLKQMLEDCGEKELVALRERFAAVKKVQDEYDKGLTEDGKYIEKAIDWILKHEFADLMGGGPSTAEVKKRILERLKELLCALGYDLCWIDIEFDIEYEQNGRDFVWKRSAIVVRKRDVKKDDCECPEEIVDDTGDGDEDDQDLDGGTVKDGSDGSYGGGDVRIYDYYTYCAALTPEGLDDFVVYSLETGYVLDAVCNKHIPDSYVLDKFAVFYGEENKWAVWEFFTSPENDGISFDFKYGRFFDGLTELFPDL